MKKSCFLFKFSIFFKKCLHGKVKLIMIFEKTTFLLQNGAVFDDLSRSMLGTIFDGVLMHFGGVFGYFLDPKTSLGEKMRICENKRISWEGCIIVKVRRSIFRSKTVFCPCFFSDRLGITFLMIFLIFLYDINPCNRVTTSKRIFRIGPAKIHYPKTRKNNVLGSGDNFGRFPNCAQSAQVKANQRNPL